MARPFSALLTALLAPSLTGLAPAQDNVLVILIDDVGVDRIAAYAEHPDPGVTPVIDELAATGVLFRNAWVHPGCTTTRASLLTGRFPSRHGLGTLVKPTDLHGLPLSEITIPEMLRGGTDGLYTSFAVGKWHLAGVLDTMVHPLDQGFVRHAGTAGNIDSYYSWEKVVDGVPSQSTTYATSDVVDEALASIQATAEPWFGWVSFQAAHQPYHWPPPELSSSFSGHEGSIAQHKAAIEALDTEIGRLLQGVDLDDTTVFLIGDNGTPPDVTDAPFDPEHAKGTTFEGGVNVPWIVTGSQVQHPGSESDALVLAVDLFATVAEIAGIDLQVELELVEHDSLSFLDVIRDPLAEPVRSIAFTESFLPNGPGPYARRQLGIRDHRFKIVISESDTGTERNRYGYYDLWNDPHEQENLIEGVTKVPPGYLELRKKLVDLLGTF